jgi:cytochrome c oxidase assembly protein subunit 15
MPAHASVAGTPLLATARGSTVALAVFRLAGLFTFLTVAMGSVVSATKSGAACPTWPGCRPDDIAPPWAMGPVIEFTHRVVAMTTGPLILAAAVAGGRLTRPSRWVRVAPWVALACAITSAAMGRRVVLAGIPAWMGTIDLFCALTAMTAMGVAAVLAARPARSETPRPEPGTPPTVSLATPPAVPPAVSLAAEPRATRTTRTAAAGAGTLVVMHAAGILTAGRGSYTSSMGWPMWRLIASDHYPWLQLVRLVLAGIAAVLVAAAAVSAMRTGPLTIRARLRAWGLAIASMLAAEMLLGAVIWIGGLRADVASAHSVLAVALLCGMAVLAANTVAVKQHPQARQGNNSSVLAHAGH